MTTTPRANERRLAGAPNDVAAGVLERLGVAEHERVVEMGAIDVERHHVSFNPGTGEPLAGIALMSGEELDAAVARSVEAFGQWRLVPAPQRGEIVRRIGLALREQKEDLGALVTVEVGKIRAEGEGEVQECIDIADFAVGLSRQLYGLTMSSERAGHRMFEQWHPLGPVGVITAFNFPVAVAFWNAMVAMVCGDAVVWKPSLLAPLTAVASSRIVRRVLREQDVWRPEGGVEAEDVFQLVLGDDATVGRPMTEDRRLPLISATGSCGMGREVGAVVAERLGRCLLELGGNNAIVLTPDADMDLALRGIVFGAVGTAGQRCTTTRRLLCVGDAWEGIVPRLVEAYEGVEVGDPLREEVLMGPLISSEAVLSMKEAIDTAEAAGCEVLAGGFGGIEREWVEAGNFVRPTLLRVPAGETPAIVREETFAPILYVQSFGTLEEAVAAHNEVPQGLSGAVFTGSLKSAERFLSAAGADTGIANVNIGTSGAEIGGAFGGEKDTGGGRESGSDAWKAYMRRQACTANYSDDLPLAQGIEFG